MAFDGRIVLFVEGSETPHHRRAEMMGTIWGNHFVNALGLKTFARIVPISKREFAAMDPRAPTSGRGVSLPQKIAAELTREEFDVAVIAWDLLPAWRKDIQKCRWKECKLLYRAISECPSLPELWRDRAARRLREMEGREAPNARIRIQPLAKGEVLTICMEPTFESILVICEQIILDGWTITDGGRVGWPNWSQYRDDPERLLQLAFEAGRRKRPPRKSFGPIRGDLRTAKNEVGEYILRKIIHDEECLEKLRRHPLAVRLKELLALSR